MSENHRSDRAEPPSPGFHAEFIETSDVRIHDLVLCFDSSVRLGAGPKGSDSKGFELPHRSKTFFVFNLS